MLTTGKIYAKGNKTQVRNGIKLCQTYLTDLTSDDVILDIGCGTGEVTYYLSETSRAEVTGVDQNLDCIQYAKLNYCNKNIKYEHLDVEVSVCGITGSVP